MCTPTTGFEGTRPAEGGYYDRPLIAGNYQQTEKPNRKDAEVPPVNRRISEPASQGHGKKQGKKPVEPKSQAERSDRTPRNRTERPDQNSRKRTAEITERREQEAELEQHAPTQPKKQKQS